MLKLNSYRTVLPLLIISTILMTLMFAYYQQQVDSLTDIINDRGSIEQALKKNPICTPDDRLRQRALLDTLQHWTKFAKKHRIQYWIAYETLVSYVQQHGLLPHSVTIHLFMMANDITQMIQLSELNFSSFYGLTIDPLSHLPKTTKSSSVSTEAFHFPMSSVRFINKKHGVHLSIWPIYVLQPNEPITENSNRSMLIEYDTNYRWKPSPKEWIFPLHECVFSGLKVWCPAEPQELVKNIYSNISTAISSIKCLNGSWTKVDEHKSTIDITTTNEQSLSNEQIKDMKSIEDNIMSTEQITKITTANKQNMSTKQTSSTAQLTEESNPSSQPTTEISTMSTSSSSTQKTTEKLILNNQTSSSKQTLAVTTVDNQSTSTKQTTATITTGEKSPSSEQTTQIATTNLLNVSTSQTTKIISTNNQAASTTPTATMTTTNKQTPTTLQTTGTVSVSTSQTTTIQTTTTKITDDDQINSALEKIPICTKRDRSSQSKLLLMFKAWAQLAEQFNLKYWISYGTLIGYVRNGGLIAYDGDVDIMMMMDDTPQLIKIAEMNFSSIYEIKIQPQWKIPDQKDRSYFRDDGINFIAPNARFVHRVWGSQVDIFPAYNFNPGYPIKSKENIESTNITMYDIRYNWISYPKNWTYPLQTCNFSNIKVLCPAEPAKLVTMLYGATALTTANKQCINGSWVAVPLKKT